MKELKQVCTFGLTAYIYGLFFWWNAPVVAAELPENLWLNFNYDVWGIPAIAYALFALMLGVCVGAILRKIVPAMLVTVILFIAIRILIEVYWRPYFLPPVVVTQPLTADTQQPQSAWFLSRSESYASGKPLPSYISGDFKDLTLPQLCTEITGSPQEKPLSPAHIQARNQCEVDGKDGILSTYVYQPGDRLLLFQEIECGIYLCMSAICLALTFWWTKHRILGEPK